MTHPLGPDPGPDIEVLATPEPFLPMSVTIDLSRLPSVGTALGVGLVSCAVALSAAYSRHTGRLDGSNFTMGVLATVGLLGVAVAAHLALPGAEPRAALVSWPGAAGALSAGLMVGVLIKDGDTSLYVGTTTAITLSVAGYAVSRAAPFVLGTIAGLAVLYGKVFDDVVDVGGNSDNAFMVVGAAILVFVLLATAGGWLLPATRDLTGVTVGAGGLLAMLALMQVMTITTAFDSFGPNGPTRSTPYRDDTYMILAYCAVLAVLWSVCSLASGHVGFRVLVVVTAVVVTPIVTFILTVEHPTWWEVVTCGAGGAILLAAGFRSRTGSAPADLPGGAGGARGTGGAPAQ